MDDLSPALDLPDHLLVLLRAGDGQNLWMRAGDVIGIRAQTPGNDDPTIFSQSFADGLQAFGLGGIQKPAGVYYDGIRPLIIA